MKAIAKNIGRLNQYVGERFNAASKHDLSDEFKQLEAQTETRKGAMEDIVDSLNQYLKSIEKRKEGNDKQKHLTVQSLGMSFVSYGSDLPEESSYGQALIKLGETEDKLGDIQLRYASKIKEGFLNKLEVYQADMKNYKHLRGKLENRRLDYDAKMNKIQKAKKEKPELDEELRTAQTKYEETMEEIQNLMISLNSCEEEQIEALFLFLDAQHAFFKESAELLAKARDSIRDPSVKGNRIRLPKASFSVSVSDASLITSSTIPTSPSATISSQVTPQRERKSYLGSASLQVPTMSAGTSRASDIHETGRKLVRANYSFMAENSNELSMQKGDVISVVEEVDAGWWMGELNGAKGLFPANYCEDIPKDISSSHQEKLLTRASSIPRLMAESSNKPQINPFEQMRSEAQETKTECGACGCKQWNESLFKPGQCTNCFHNH